MTEPPKSLLRSALEIALGRGAVAVLSLAFLAYFARVLPKPVLGFVAVQAALVMLVKILTDLGFHFRVIREATPLLRAGRTGTAVDQVLAPATMTRATAAMLLTVLLLAAGLFFVEPLGRAIPGIDMRLALPFASGHILLKTFQYLLAPIYHARERFWVESLLDSGSATTEKILAYALFIWGGTDHYFTGLMLGQGVTLVLAVWFERDILARFRPRHLQPIEALRSIRTYLPDYQRVLYRRGMRQIDRLVIAAMLPMAQVANYHVARQGTQFLRFVIRSVADPLMVRLASDPGLEKHSGDKKLFYFVAIWVPFVVAFASPWLILVLGGAGYGDAWPLMAALAISFVFYGLSEYQLAIITMMGSREEPVHLEAVAGLFGIAATVLMVAWIGEIGAAAGQISQFALLYLGGRVVTRRLVARVSGRADGPPEP